jgi:hypothetical protein
MTEPDLIITKPSDVWILTDLQVRQARSGTNFWRIRLETGRRAVTCRECGMAIQKGPRLFARHVNTSSRTYDVKAYLHQDLAKCAELKIEHEFLQWEASRVAAYLADPGSEERFWDGILGIKRSI